MTESARASRRLGVVAIVVFSAAIAAAWATDDFWETGPLAASTAAVGTLTLLSSHKANRRAALAITLGVSAAMLTVLATLLVTAGRWAR